MSEIRIVEATTQSLDEFVTLLEQVGEWLWAKGVKQWKPGAHREEREQLINLVENGCLILAYQNEVLCGGCILSEVLPQEWPDVPNILALNKLAVARSVAGQGVGSQIIQACIRFGTKQGKSAIRLDCWDGNDFLKSYYQDEGFTMLEAIEGDGYYCRLFEKQIVWDTYRICSRINP
ncbi:GNAT family N-acetyltransferase [Chloroflexi bacterium TSY]|nr:GNAT family N-acetyltransferase [Chloroflexi bacterium TSY]